jgi:cell division protein ZapA (FtsZ GTPase activity inhibitor)
MSQESQRSTVTVRIGGEEHVLRSTAEPEYAKQCADFLDKRVREVRQLGGSTETHRAVILAALAITDEYFRAREELNDLRQEVTARSLDLARKVEEAVAGR